MNVMRGARAPLGGTFGRKTSGGVAYRDYAFEDGYTYRQYSDGSILIVTSPKGGAGTLVTQETHPDAWQAITAQIAGQKSARTGQYIQAGTQVLTAVTRAIAPPPRRRRKAAPVVVEAPAASVPWVPIGLAAGGVIALLVLMRRP